MRIAVLIMLVSLVSCGLTDGRGPLAFSVKIEEAVRAEDVDFKVLQKKILPKCIGCHKDWTSEEVVNRFTRENIPEESLLFTSVEEGRMPKNSPPLDPELLEIVRNYVTNIRYTRPVEEPLPDDGMPVSFATVHEKVFTVSCLPCHSGRLGTEAGLSASPWINKADPTKSKLLTSVVSGRMPKQRNLLTDNQIELIRRYLRNFQTR